MTPREPNILDRLASLIPGYKGYADRDARRTADQRLRSAIADELRTARATLDRLAGTLAESGRLDEVSPLGRLAQRIGTCADTLRTAVQGASGAFDDVVVRAEDLDRVHAHDLQLAEAAQALAGRIRDLTPESVVASLADVQAGSDSLLDAVRRRDAILTEVF